MKIIDYEKFLVKLLFTYEVKGKKTKDYGSGVIVNPFEYSDYLYVFTAKHTFEKKVRDQEYPDDIKKVLFDDEYIKSNLKIELSRLLHQNTGDSNTTNFYPSYVDTITRIIEIEDKELDLLIFEICIKDIEIDIEPLSIDKNYFDRVVVAGFPNVREGLPYGYSSSFYRYYDDSKIYYELKSNEKLYTNELSEYNAIKGISGGGVFVERNETIYLVGIQIKYEKPESFKCINFQTLYRLINSILKSRTSIISIPVDLDSGQSFDIEMVEVNLKDKKLCVGKYPVTYLEYDISLKDRGLQLTSTSYTNIEKEQYPVVNISWNDVQDYCMWLSKIIGKEVKLLSSVDWNFIVENNILISDLKMYCTFSATELQPINNVDEDIFGLNDILGNICEWCDDGNERKKYIKGIAFYDNLKSLEQVLEEKTMVRKSTVQKHIGFRIVF